MNILKILQEAALKIPLQRRGARRAGWLIQGLKCYSTTPSGYACHPSSGGEFPEKGYVRKRSAMICFIAVFLCLSLANASPVSDLNTKLTSLETISAHFTQTVYDQNNQVLSKSTGSLVLMRPNKFRFSIDAPSAQLTVSDGKTLTTYQPDLQQVTISPLPKNTYQTPLSILSGEQGGLQKAFMVTENGNSFILIPKDKNSNFQKIQLVFQGDLLTSMTLWDNFSQKTNLAFSDVSQLLPSDKNLFSFMPPKGVDIIDNRH
jgi:outer membrane lipoprotein carrier protein